MIEISEAEEGKAVYFVVDLSEYGGAKFIGMSTIAKTEQKWVKLASGFHYRAKDLFFSIGDIPSFTTLEVRTFLTPCTSDMSL